MTSIAVISMRNQGLHFIIESRRARETRVFRAEIALLKSSVGQTFLSVVGGWVGPFLAPETAQSSRISAEHTDN